MSKLDCKCGGVIADNSDHLSYKGDIFRDQHLDLIEKVADDIASYLEAKLSHNERDWLSSRFGHEFAEMRRSDSQIICFMITHLFGHGVTLRVYQCLQCRRIYIENSHRLNHFFSFAPEDEDAIDVLKVGD